MVFEVGDKAYILENNIRVTKVTIVDRVADMYTVRFPNGGGTRLRHSRLYRTEKEAQGHIRLRNPVQEAPAPKKHYLSPYDYWY